MREMRTYAMCVAKESEREKRNNLFKYNVRFLRREEVLIKMHYTFYRSGIFQ